MHCQLLQVSYAVSVYHKKKKDITVLFIIPTCILWSLVYLLCLLLAVRNRLKRNSQTTTMNFTDFCDTLINSNYYKAMIPMWVSLGGPVQDTFKNSFFSGVKNKGNHFIQTRNYDLKCSFINYMINLEFILLQKIFIGNLDAKIG